MDDRQVRDVIDESVVTSAAYLLLYKRRHEKGGQVGTAPSASETPSPSVATTSARLNYSDPEEID